ncbi:hypothetical protein [Methylorubrum salsuginis]|uniref:Lipoprotein n=1 Tax=Methylorubrum salsuginis TaxID=414703 RepID=A0A1I4A0W2_9HYPH|nr:hypothetical protein [Methylorubrum salsuginis]SFK49581.1 hypothetical protein SAMN04488125_102177 [Methylorubrum salsuginis]
MRSGGGVWGAAGLATWLAVWLGACTTAAPPPSPGAPAGTLRERIAALALGQVEFGSVSLLPVRREHSRIAGPFEDGGRRLYCVKTRMFGRTFGKPERPKIVVRDDNGALSVLRDEEDVCEGHRSEPFPELDTASAPA